LNTSKSIVFLRSKYMFIHYPLLEDAISGP
jgi:hypothetical protein